MSTLLVASLQPGEGRTTATAALGALLADEDRAVRLLRVRAGDEADPAAEDDARAFAAVPGCASPRGAVSEQEAQTQAKQAQLAGELCLIEAPPGPVLELATRLSARVLLVSEQADERRLADLASAAGTLGEALLGLLVTRQSKRMLAAVQGSIAERGLPCLAVVPEDRLLAGPTVHEMAEALHASRLVETAPEDEAVEFVMLGPISADPGQPYFLQHGSKAVVNRFDKMDLHLAALATGPDCLILTGGQLPSPYFLDRVHGHDQEISVLLSPEDTVRTVALLDDLYTRTRFSGQRKLQRAADLLRQHLDVQQLAAALS